MWTLIAPHVKNTLPAIKADISDNQRNLCNLELIEAKTLIICKFKSMII